MSTETIATVAPDVLADAEAVIEALASGRKPDADVMQRIERRSEKSRERILRQHGHLDVSVPEIRDLRDQ